MKQDGLYLPSYYIRERESPPPTTQLGIAGYMHWQIIDAHGRIVREAETEHKNLVVNAGLNDWAATLPTLGALTHLAAVGTQASPTAPAVTDIALQAQLGARVTAEGGQADVYSAIETPTGAFRARLVRTREFAAAHVGGQNLTEWGFFRNATGAPMFSRDLFRDGGGTPITLTPATDQGLRLVYTLELTYDERTNTLINQTYWGNTDVQVEWCWWRGGNSAATFGQQFFTAPFYAWSTASGDGGGIHNIADIPPAPTFTGTIPASPVVHTSFTDAAYTADSFQRDRTIIWGTTVLNTGPYAHLTLRLTGLNREWYRFTRSAGTERGITAKTNLQEYRFTFRRRVVRT